MSLPVSNEGMPNDMEASVSSRVPISPWTSRTPGTALIAPSLLYERGPLENMLEPSADTITLSE